MKLMTKKIATNFGKWSLFCALVLVLLVLPVSAHHDGGGGRVHWNKLEEPTPITPTDESFFYSVCVDVGGQDPDMLLVIGADPSDTATYSKIINRVDMPNIGDELHHFGYNLEQTKLMVPGAFSGRIHILDVETDPAHPVITAVNEDLIADSGYIVPHTVIPLPNGNNLLTMIGANTATTAPGGMVEIDAETGEFVRYFGAEPDRNFDDKAPKYMYDFGFKLELNRAISTSFGLPADIGPGITITGLGTELYVWDLKKRKVIQRVDIGAGTGALEVRWLGKHGSTIGYTNAPGTSEIWAWDDLDGDGFYNFQVVIALSPFSIPTDMLLSSDDKYMYVANWVANSVHQYNIENPLNPVFVDSVTIPYAQMLRLSQDNERLYVTNSLLSTWDDTEFPAGVTRNDDYGIFLIDVDHANGGMTLNTGFHVDTMNIQKKNTVGACRPHQVIFDPSVKRPFGGH